ncbi:Chitin synthase, class 2 [Chytridiales sp. JEL 0842]|nr:Chitin synthase, class 2 [Chytridiales sp. JEL 0842]
MVSISMDSQVDPSYSRKGSANALLMPSNISTTTLVRSQTVQALDGAYGNLVIEVPVPQELLKTCKNKEDKEFTHVRYTACTVDPDAFPFSGYVLRQQKLQRDTELFIVVTMYNEDDYLFNKTMLALMKNISYLCQRSRSSTWGENGWKKVVICIVSDGRAKINPRVLNVLGIMGVYQEGLMKNKVNDKDVTAHIFEYTTQIALDTENNIRDLSTGLVPVQILFCLKEKNAKKINSHRWFFSAFGPLLKPNVCVLIDVGTKPTPTSIYHLWKAFDSHPNVGGACGEIYAELGKGCSNLLNPLVAAQNFEYKMSNILDKPLESVCGYISVLPGAFSAYRYAAIQGVPLAQYFKGETMHDGGNIFAANMYLAEDRILCFEVTTKQGQAWLLRYVKAAKAETDVPDAVPEFISQRRRWLNGSFFAGLHALSHWHYIFRSSHNILRKLLLCLEFMYNFISLIFSWFSIGNFYLTFKFLLDDPISAAVASRPFKPLGPKPEWVVFSLRNIYLMCLVLIFICSMGNRPQGSKLTYTSIMIFFALIMGVMLYIAGYAVYTVSVETIANYTSVGDLMKNGVFRDYVLSLGSTYGLYFLMSFLHFEPWHMFTSFLQYLFLLPSYVNILMVYSFCNLHDVSWGTKGDNKVGSDLGVAKSSKGKDGKDVFQIEVAENNDEIYNRWKKEIKMPKAEVKAKRDAKTKQDDYFKSFRTNLILWWMLSNAVLVIVLTSDVLSSSLYTALGVGSSSGMNPYLKARFFIMMMYLQ